MSSAAEELIAEMRAEAYSPASSKAFWAKYEPQMLEFLKELESREDWVSSGVGRAEDKLVELISYLPSSGPLPDENLVSFMRILSALPYGESIHALLWLDVRNAPAVPDVLAYTFKHRESIASANIMWQRLERVARFHVLSGLVEDLKGAAAPDLAELTPPPAKPVEIHSAPKGEMPTHLGARRLKVMRNEESMPFMNEARTIASLNEVDELFGNRRFYLLTDDIDLCKSLAPYGVGTDQYGGFVTRGPAVDFDKLDALLPFVARRSIKPILGDLIPYSSWASNLSRLLTRHSWDKIRLPLIEATGHRCEICGAKESGREIDCHEQWEYHEPMFTGSRGVQKLVGFWVVCAECHATHHMTRHNANSRSSDALERLRRINRMSERETQAYRAFVFDRLDRRSKMEWVLDLTLLAKHEPLVVHSAWQVDAECVLTRENQVSEGKTVRSQTVLYGVSWVSSAKDSKVVPARAVEDAYYE